MRFNIFTYFFTPYTKKILFNHHKNIDMCDSISRNYIETCHRDYGSLDSCQTKTPERCLAWNLFRVCNTFKNFHKSSDLKMPKKFAGENSKAVAARARKTAAKEEDERRREKEKEDEYWKDDDKLIQKKLQRKEQQEKKRQEQLQKKAELKDLLEKEDLTLKSQKKMTPKVTKAMILEEQERRNAAALGKKKEPETHLTKRLEENINRLQVDGMEARSVTEAISILSTKDEEDDKHPEKRMKAAYAAFEAANLPRIKAENPTLRLSQWKQILNKDWMRSPENPMNQRRA